MSACQMLEVHVLFLNKHSITFAKLDLFVKQYLECRAAAPFSTSACVVMPSWQGKWRRLSGSMQLLRSYAKGMLCYSVEAEVNTLEDTAVSSRFAYEA